jgi:hypothetical protein
MTSRRFWSVNQTVCVKAYRDSNASATTAETNGHALLSRGRH